MRYRKVGLSIEDRIKNILEEIRIVLPGTETLLGFQLAAVFSGTFGKLPHHLQYLYLANLGLITLSVIFLISPVAYDRIVDNERELSRLYKFSTLMIRLALVCLSLGLSGSLFIVVYIISQSLYLSGIFSGILFTLSICLWFLYSTYRKNQR